MKKMLMQLKHIMYVAVHCKQNQKIEGRHILLVLENCHQFEQKKKIIHITDEQMKFRGISLLFHFGLKCKRK